MSPNRLLCLSVSLQMVAQFQEVMETLGHGAWLMDVDPDEGDGPVNTAGFQFCFLIPDHLRCEQVTPPA